MSLGVDETAFLKATQDPPTLFATGLVDLDERIVIDVTCRETPVMIWVFGSTRNPSRGFWRSVSWRRISLSRTGRA